MHRYQFEKGSKKYTCPACGERRRFRRYVDVETGGYLADDVGKCDRESSCGWHKTPKQWAVESGQWSDKKGPLDIKPIVNIPPKPYDYHDPVWLNRAAIICGRPIDRRILASPLVQFLGNLFPDRHPFMVEVLIAYKVGQFINEWRRKYTMFPYLSIDGKFARGKLIEFDPANGKRSKAKFGTSSLRHELKLKKDWNYDNRVFFGEHLTVRTDRPAAVVESEKTALIGAITHPEFIWLATGTKGSLSVDKLKRITQPGGRRVVLFPDTDAHAKWTEIAVEAIRSRLPVEVSQLVMDNTTDEQKSQGYDIADLLISEQQARLEGLAEREAIMAEG